MSDAAAVVIWWLIIQVLAAAVWPTTSRLFRWLPDRGYMLAKPLGLLLVSYVLWLLASLRILPNTPPGILSAVLLVAAVNWLPTLRRRPFAIRPSPADFRLVVLFEALFAAAFIGWAIFRAHVPDATTGEKPMELAFLNGVARSEYFPPHDPWLAGYDISYYYFGYVMLSLLGKISGVGAGVAFSLSNALWFALSAASAFGVVVNLVLLSRRAARRAAVGAGLLGASLLVLMGNWLAPLEVAYSAGWGPPEWWTRLDILDLNQPAGLPSGGRLPWPLRSDPAWWYRSSRVIHDYAPVHISPHLAVVLGVAPDPGAVFQEVIAEFPQFSFLSGDMHPHTLNLPFVLLAIGLAVNAYWAGATGAARSIRRMPIWIIYPILLGGLGFLNTWDFPVYTALLVAAFAVGHWQAGRVIGLRYRALELAALGTLGALAYLPFYLNFNAQLAGPWPNLFNGTRASHFVILFGPFIVLGLMFGASVAAPLRRSQHRYWATLAAKSIGGGLVLTLAAAALAALVGATVYALSPELRGWFDGLLAQMAERGITLGAHLVARLSDPWVPLALGSAMSAIGWLWRSLRSQPSPEPSPVPLALLLLCGGLALVFIPEFGFIVDAFRTRRNTVFKFYYQAWVLWSVASAYAAYYLWSGPARVKSPAGRAGLATAIGLSVGLGLAYPALAIPTRIADAASQPMLDAVLATARSTRYPGAGDAYAAAQWLNEHVPGTPIILEQSEDADNLSPAQSRISSWTGLPTLVGWPDHEAQWRGRDDDWTSRLPAIAAIYSTADPAQAMALLREYGVAYVYIGARERSRYPADGLAKFEAMFPIVFRQGDAAIFQVTPP